MELTAFEWVLIGGGAALAIGVIGFFLSRTIKRVDKHDADISTIHQEYALREEVAAQGKDINEIKLTYVTKSDLRETESEFKAAIEKLTDGVSEIRNNYLTKGDFYRTEVKTEQKLEKIYQKLLTERGGTECEKK